MPAKTAKKSAPDYGEYTAHESADAFPLMKQEDLQRLADDIRENGQLDDIEILTGTNQIVDGRNRYLACRLAGAEPRVTEISEDDMPSGIFDYVVSKNLLRRQLTAAQRQGVVKKLREGGHSIRAIAELTGIPRATVGRDLKEMSQSGQLDQPEKIEGKDGRERPATMPQSERPSHPSSKALEIFRERVEHFDGFSGSLSVVTIPDDISAEEMERFIKSLRKGRTLLGQFIKRIEGGQPESPEPETVNGSEVSTKQVNDWLRSEGRESEITRGQVSNALKREYIAAHPS